MRLFRELGANMASLQSHLGGGNHGHMGILMDTDDYELIAVGTPFEPPDDPGWRAVVPPGSTADKTATIVREYNETCIVYNMYNNAMTIACQQMHTAIPE